MPYADLTDVRLYYELRGNGPPLLLIPGLGMLCTTWGCVADDLARHFSVIMPDLRGMGLSTEEKRVPHHLSDYAVDLVELLDHLQVDKAHVLGVSLGGVLAQQLTLDHPSRVNRLVLISCADRFSHYLREIASLLGQILRHFPKELYYRTVELLGTAPQFLDAHPEILEERVKWARENGSPRKAIGRQLKCLSVSSFGEHEYDIKSPTLVIASEYDVLIPNCYSRQMAERIPGSEYILIPAAGHNPLTEVPELIVPKIIAFLESRLELKGGNHKEVASKRRPPTRVLE